MALGMVNGFSRKYVIVILQLLWFIRQWTALAWLMDFSRKYVIVTLYQLLWFIRNTRSSY